MSFSKSSFARVALVVLNLLLLIPLGIYASATPFSRMGYDDFCSAITAQTYGIPGAVTWWYNHLNGRFIAFSINSATTLIGPPLQALYVTFLLLVWWGALFLLFRRLLRRTAYVGLQAGILTSLLMLATLAAVPSIAATLFWYTGTSMYLLSLIAFTCYLALLTLMRFQNRLGLVLGGLFCLVAAGASDTGGLTVVLCLLAAIAFSLRHPDSLRRQRPLLIAGLIGAVVAMVLMLAAPGNSVRAALSPAPSLNYALQVIVSSPGAPMLVAFHFAPLQSTIVFILALVAGYFAPIAAPFIVKRRARLAVLAMFAAYAILMTVSFGPVAYFLSSGLNEHAWITPVCLFMLLLGGGGFALGVSFKPRRVVTVAPQFVQAIVVLLLAVVALSSTAFALDTAAHQRTYAAAWDARDANIRARVAQGQGTRWSGAFTNPYDMRIKVDSNSVPLTVDSLRPESWFKWEADDDPNTLANRCIARYYGLIAVVGAP